jgi:hypothetical protein
MFSRYAIRSGLTSIEGRLNAGCQVHPPAGRQAHPASPEAARYHPDQNLSPASSARWSAAKSLAASKCRSPIGRRVVAAWRAGQRYCPGTHGGTVSPADAPDPVATPTLPEVAAVSEVKLIRHLQPALRDDAPGRDAVGENGMRTVSARRRERLMV